VSLVQVKHNFEVYGLLDEQVRFLPGWFCDSLPDAPVEQLAVLRLDGDLYESQRDVLVSMEPRVSPGGFIIIDDYHFPGVKRAVHEYREQHRIKEPIYDVVPEQYTSYWRKG
jgi:predicted O-methyltransferase YrrM